MDFAGFFGEIAQWDLFFLWEIIFLLVIDMAIKWKLAVDLAGQAGPPPPLQLNERGVLVALVLQAGDLVVAAVGGLRAVLGGGREGGGGGGGGGGVGGDRKSTRLNSRHW